MPVRQIVWLAIAGALGTLCRYGLSSLVLRIVGAKFAWGTLLVNVLGCLLFGMVWSLTEQRIGLGQTTRLVVLTGFMGAFTTFSTFAFDTYWFAQDSRWSLAFANLAAHNVIGILCIVAGIQLIQYFFR